MFSSGDVGFFPSNFEATKSYTVNEAIDMLWSDFGDEEDDLLKVMRLMKGTKLMKMIWKRLEDQITMFQVLQRRKYMRIIQVKFLVQFSR